MNEQKRRFFLYSLLQPIMKHVSPTDVVTFDGQSLVYKTGESIFNTSEKWQADMFNNQLYLLESLITVDTSFSLESLIPALEEIDEVHRRVKSSLDSLNYNAEDLMNDMELVLTLKELFEKVPYTEISLSTSWDSDDNGGSYVSIYANTHFEEDDQDEVNELTNDDPDQFVSDQIGVDSRWFDRNIEDLNIRRENVEGLISEADTGAKLVALCSVFLESPEAFAPKGKPKAQGSVIEDDSMPFID